MKWMISCTSVFSQIKRSVCSIDISDVITEYGRLMDGLAIYSAGELRLSGLPLPIGVEHRYKGALINSYLLNSCLCYVEMKTKNGKTSFYATKHLGIIRALSDVLDETDKRKKVENFYEQLTTSNAELSSNIFEIIRLQNDRDGLKLFKHRLNLNRKDTVIMPMYSVGNRIDHIIHTLSNHRVMITYSMEGKDYKLATSLRSDAIAKWLNTNNSKEIKKVQEGWQNPYSPITFCPSHFIQHDELKTSVLADLRQLSENALDRDSLVEKALKKVNEKSSQTLTELKAIQKKSQQLQQEQLELVRALTRKMNDDDTFQMSNKALKEEQHTLKARATILETVVNQGEANERIMQQFREEVRRFAELQIDDEETLREVLQRLIERIEIELDGGIIIHYNFGNPLSAGA